MGIFNEKRQFYNTTKGLFEAHDVLTIVHLRKLAAILVVGERAVAAVTVLSRVTRRDYCYGSRNELLR